MRTKRFAAITADPALGEYSRLQRGQRMRMWAVAAAAGQVTVDIMLGQTQVFTGPIMAEEATGVGVLTTTPPLFDEVSARDVEVTFEGSYGTSNIDLIVAIG